MTTPPNPFPALRDTLYAAITSDSGEVFEHELTAGYILFSLTIVLGVITLILRRRNGLQFYSLETVRSKRIFRPNAMAAFLVLIILFGACESSIFAWII